MGIVYRPYQAKGVLECIDALKVFSRVLYVLPTGGGKTVTFSGITDQYDGSVLAMAHRDELLTQISETMQRCGVPEDKIEVGSVIKIANSIGKREPPDLIICDEAHHAVASTYNKIFKAWPNVKLIGVTATPCRLDGRGLGEVFEKMILGPSMQELIRDGYLVPSKIYSIPSADFSKLKKSRGDIDSKALNEAFEEVKPVIFGDMIRHYKDKADGKRFVVFTHSVSAAHEAAAEFVKNGYKCAVLDGGLSKTERKQIVSQILSGDLDGIASCEIVSEGFDCPGLEVAILLRPTAALSLYLQQVGRVLRPADLKMFGIILDHVGNCRKFGPPEIDRVWSLEGKEQGRAKSANDIKTKACPECLGTYITGPKECPYCGHVNFTEAREIKQISGELVLYEYGERVETVMSASQYGYLQRALELKMPDGSRPRTKQDYELLGYSENEAWNFLRAVKKARENNLLPKKDTTMAQRNNSGAIFANDRKTQANHPDGKGSCMIDGKEYWISSWTKKTNEGKVFRSLSFELKQAQQGAPTQGAPAQAAPSDDLPF